MSDFTVLHASTFEPSDTPVFAHAAAVARAGDARLVSMHASTGEVVHPPEFQETLENWGYEGVEFQMIDHTCCDDPVDTLLNGIRGEDPELVVLGTHGRSGLQLWAEGSMSQAIVANVDVPVLVVPLHGRRLVDLDTGRFDLRKVLIPVEDDASADRSLALTAQLLDRLGVDDLDIYLLHVGRGDVLESSLFPEHGGWRGHRLQREGNLNEAIKQACTEFGVDLVVMSTHGTDSIKDFFFGTHTEQAMREATCPFLAIPGLR